MLDNAKSTNEEKDIYSYGGIVKSMRANIRKTKWLLTDPTNVEGVFDEKVIK